MMLFLLALCLTRWSAWNFNGNLIQFQIGRSKGKWEIVCVKLKIWLLLHLMAHILTWSHTNILFILFYNFIQNRTIPKCLSFSLTKSIDAMEIQLKKFFFICSVELRVTYEFSSTLYANIELSLGSFNNLWAIVLHCILFTFFYDSKKLIAFNLSLNQFQIKMVHE